jgi:hypothetical protein
MMDPFFDPFWNLDQVCAWACTRDPEVVRFAAAGTRRGSPKSTRAINIRSAHAALKSKQAGRDVNLELWLASGWPMPENAYIAPMAVERLANDLGVPIFQILNDASLEVRFPRCEITDRFLQACSHAGEADLQILQRLFRGAQPEDGGTWLDDTAVASLSPELRQRLVDYVNREEVQGPWRLLRHADFPIEDYLVQLFRTGRLTADANLPDNPDGRALTKADWGGLEIAAGGDRQRLSVWRIGYVSKSGGGDFENARVERDAVLREFPEGPPLAQSLSIPATDDAARAVIRQALADSGGFLSQEKGAEIVRSKFPTFLKKRAMQLVKELTGNEKPGPKGPRKNRAANRAG